MSVRLAVVLLLFLLPCKQGVSKACSIWPIETLLQYDDSEYLFEGQIIDYAKTEMGSGSWKADTWGLKILVSHITYPSMDLDTVEVYRFGLSAWCDRLPLTLEQVKKRYEIGSNVIVVANKSKVIDSADEMSVRLEARPFYNGVYPVNEEGKKPRHIRLRELLYNAAHASTGRQGDKIESLALIREYYATPATPGRYPKRRGTILDSLAYVSEIFYSDELNYSATVLRYVETEEEMSLLEKKLEMLDLPGLPKFLESEEGKAYVKRSYHKIFPEYRLQLKRQRENDLIRHWVLKMRRLWKRITIQ